MSQQVFVEQEIIKVMTEIFEDKACKKVFIVCDAPCMKLKIADEVAKLAIEQVWFSDFTPNPDYVSVVEGIKKFKEHSCDVILAIGGGSSMDVAKCIKLFSTMDDSVNYLEQQVIGNDIPLMAIPTTAGTGSEATRFAVIYYCGEKQSIVHDSIIPEYVFMNSDVLAGLPLYQKKATAMDALCHAIESFWSVNSNEDSKKYSREAISLISDNLDDYLNGNAVAASNMLLAANAAGKAINITQTTAGHAMCYKITSIYQLPHGHAAALCVERLWPYMIEHVEDCLDARGTEYLKNVFAELADAFGCDCASEAADKFSALLSKLDLYVLHAEDDEQIDKLVKSVNLTRLKNNPVLLSSDALEKIYREVLRGKADGSY